MNYTDNNNIKFLPSGLSSYELRWELLNNAISTIHLATFSFMKDDTTKKLFDLLKVKAKQGVKIKIIYDDIVNRTTFVGNWIEDLQSYGIEVCAYNSITEGWHIDFQKGHPFKQIMMNVKLKLKQHFHEKYFIVDNQHLIIGGINWGDKYAFGGLKPGAWRDTDVYLRGDVVKDVQMQFLKDFEMQKEWKLQLKNNKKLKYQQFVLNYLNQYSSNKNVLSTYPELMTYEPNIEFGHKIKVAYVSHKPYDRNELSLTNLFLEKIKNAKTRIYWGCHGIRPPRIFAEYFVEAIQRGVKIVLITNSKESSKTLMVNGLLGWMYSECKKHFKFLIENGVEVYEWQKKGAFHSKNLIIDDDFVSIGSYNIANGSAFHHSESNIIIEDKSFCNEVYSQFLIDLSHCQKLSINNTQFPQVNAFNRILHERNKMIRNDLLTDSIKKDLDNGNYKQFPLYEFIDIS